MNQTTNVYSDSLPYWSLKAYVNVPSTFRLVQKILIVDLLQIS